LDQSRGAGEHEELKEPLGDVLNRRSASRPGTSLSRRLNIVRDRSSPGINPQQSAVLMPAVPAQRT
jgi:hypothetical protein